MATQLNPYLSFGGDAREAMEFYRSVFGGELTLSTYADFGPADAPGADTIMHGRLEAGDGFVLMGADTPPGSELSRGNDCALSLSGDDEAVLRGYWDRLAERGSVSVPLEHQMWGDVFGMCTDRYGVEWMVNIEGEEA